MFYLSTMFVKKFDNLYSFKKTLFYYLNNSNIRHIFSLQINIILIIIIPIIPIIIILII